MFDDTKQPEDIFSETDKSAPQVLPPTMPTPIQEPAVAPPVVAPPVVALPAYPQEISVSSPHGGGLKSVVIVVAILVVIGAAFLVSWRILRSRTPVTPLAPETSDQPQEAETRSVEPEPTPLVAPEPVLDTDTDNDGLPDLLEAQLGTNQNLPDTDADGLFDREEVEVYLTDPLNPDTDADSYVDGKEVQGGYDPKGPGKLLVVPGGS